MRTTKNGREAGMVIAVISLTAIAAPVRAEDDGHLSMPLASFATRLDVEQPARSANIEIAASRLDGACIEPGATLSFDATVGPRRIGDGYLLAPAILDGEKEMAPAGGVCQLSTTLYNAALAAGLAIVERHPHARPSHYVAPGRDATVARFHKDLKVRNDLDQPVEIRARVIGDSILVGIFGVTPSGVAATIETRTLSQDPLEVVTYRVTTRGGQDAPPELLSRDVYR
ncbi:MAG: VanW family protein [bacterium]